MFGLETLIFLGLKAAFGKAAAGVAVKTVCAGAAKAWVVHDVVQTASAVCDAIDTTSMVAMGTPDADNGVLLSNDIQGNEQGRTIHGTSSTINGQGNPGDVNGHGVRPGNVYGPY